jgi:single-strand DNA-binding protein
MLNRVSLIGHLGADPEVHSTNSGAKVVNFRLATSERWKDKETGEKKERTEWHTIVVFNEGLAKVAEQYLKKGSKVYVEGKLQTRKWQDKEGADRWSTEVVLTNGGDAKITMLDSAGTNGSGRPPAAESPDDYGKGDSYDTRGKRDPNPDAGAGKFERELDDEIPF